MREEASARTNEPPTEADGARHDQPKELRVRPIIIIMIIIITIVVIIIIIIVIVVIIIIMTNGRTDGPTDRRTQARRHGPTRPAVI